MRRLRPYLLLAVLVLGSGFAIGLGLSEAPGRSVQGSLAAGLPASTASTVPVTVPPSTSPQPTTTPESNVAATRCQDSELRLTAPSQQPSPQTGQHLLLLALMNVGAEACYLFGYPGIGVYDASNRLLPLDYHWGGDQEVTDAAPTRVGLAPGGTAYVLVNKYRCDLGIADAGITLQLIPPDDTKSLVLNIQNLMSEDYCVPGADGSTLSISPIEPTVQATLSG